MIVNILLLDYSDRMKLPCCPTRAGKIVGQRKATSWPSTTRSEEHTSELQSQSNLVCRLLLEKKKNQHSSLFRSYLLPPYPTLHAFTESSPGRPALYQSSSPSAHPKVNLSVHTHDLGVSSCLS